MKITKSLIFATILGALASGIWLYAGVEPERNGAEVSQESQEKVHEEVIKNNLEELEASILILKALNNDDNATVHSIAYERLFISLINARVYSERYPAYSEFTTNNAIYLDGRQWLDKGLPNQSLEEEPRVEEEYVAQLQRRAVENNLIELMVHLKILRALKEEDFAEAERLVHNQLFGRVTIANSQIETFPVYSDLITSNTNYVEAVKMLDEERSPVNEEDTPDSE